VIRYEIIVRVVEVLDALYGRVQALDRRVSEAVGGQVEGGVGGKAERLRGRPRASFRS
jgi:hypothetical protein